MRIAVLGSTESWYVKDLRRGWQELTGTNVKLDIAEIKDPDVDAQLVAENIASQLTPFL